MATAEAGSRRRRWIGVPVAVVVVALGLAAYYLQSPTAVGDRARTPPGTPPAGTVREAVHEAVRARPVRGMPTRVVIPTLGVDAPVVPIRTVGAVLVPPSDPQQLGWWAGGALPGAARGSALVTGHTVHTGGGAFDHLDELRQGDPLRVRTSHGWIAYTVRGVETYSKGITAARSRQLFSQTSRGRLVLITCTDWDGTRYLSNVLVTATETTAGRTAAGGRGS